MALSRGIALWYRRVGIPAGLLSSLVIGAGFFSLPYIVSVSGILPSLVYLVGLTYLVLRVHLMYAEVIRATPGEHRFVGFAGIYLGRSGFALATLSAAAGLVLGLTIYLVLSAGFVRLIVPSWSSSEALLFFWLVGTLPLFASLRRLATLEFLVTAGIVLIVALLAAARLLTPLSGVVPPLFSSDLALLILPFGPILFSLSGRAAISSLVAYERRDRADERSIRSAITFGSLVPAFVYAVFVFAVLGLSGGGVSKEAISGLLGLSPAFSTLLGLLGLFSLWTSYAVLGLELESILALDFKLNRLAATSLIALAPLLLYAAGFSDFILLVSLAGGIFLALENTLVVHMWERVKGATAFSRAAILVFSAGAVYEIASLFLF